MNNSEVKNQNPVPLYDLIMPAELRDEEVGGWLHRADEGPDMEPGSFRIGEYIFDVRLWAEGASPHWLTPPMRDEDREALVASIGEQGILDSVTISHTGEVVDGYHRLTAWLTLVLAGATSDAPPYRLVRFRNREDEKKFVLAANIARRHLSKNDKEELLRALLRDGHLGTDAWLGRIVGLHAETVKEIRVTLEALPLADGGIEFKEHRVSEAGKRYQQKRAEPVTQKRRREAKVPSAKEPQTKDAVDDRKEEKKYGAEPKLCQEVKDEEAVSTGEVGVDESNQPEPLALKEKGPIYLLEEVEVEDDLKALVADWWQEYQFLPVLSKELAILQNKRTGAEEGPGDATRMTLMVKPMIGRAVGGHMILCRKLSANVSLFMLAPALSMSGHDLDWRTLTDKAGKMADQKDKTKAA